MLDPRRPLGEPTPADADERLARYAPFLPVTHKTVLTYSHLIPNINALLSLPTALESTALVAISGKNWYQLSLYIASLGYTLLHHRVPS